MPNEQIFEDVLKELIRLYTEEGCPPPVKVLREATGHGKATLKALEQGVARGFLERPYKGSYIPIKALDGTPVTLPQRATDTHTYVTVQIPIPRQGVESLSEGGDLEALSSKVGQVERLVVDVEVEKRLLLLESQNKKLISSFRDLRNTVQDNIRALREDQDQFNPILTKMREIFE